MTGFAVMVFHAADNDTQYTMPICEGELPAHLFFQFPEVYDTLELSTQ
jgi:hypothetical protein